MFHVKNNLYFGRTEDGHVRIVKFSGLRVPHVMWKQGEDAVTRAVEYPDANGEFQSVTVELDFRLSPEEWASVVASVSAGGEASGRFYEALNFHTAASAQEPKL